MISSCLWIFIKYSKCCERFFKFGREIIWVNL